MSSSVQNDSPVLTFEGKRYDLNTLPDELKELVRGISPKSRCLAQWCA